VLVNRSFEGTLIRLHQGNQALWWVTGIVFALLALALFSPAGRALLDFGPLHSDDLTEVAVIVISVVLMLNLLKRRWRTKLFV
jgi:Ca2+-transporting ATPase